MAAPIFETLLRDPVVDSALGDGAFTTAMIDVERALARAQGQLGVIPGEQAQQIDQGLQGYVPAINDLKEGVQSAGVPVPALVEALRKALAPKAAGYLHWGATSQDIIDTALILCIRNVLAQFGGRLNQLADALAKRIEDERQTPMLARTRFQQAVPTTLGLRFASWLMPILRHQQRLHELEPRLFLLQFGGAAGNLSTLGTKGNEVARLLAKELDLIAPPISWHAQRDGFFELAAVASGITGTLGKLGFDVVLASQNEVAELQEAKGGGSSTMPNKANPVRAETLVAISRCQAGHLATMQQALIHALDRDGSAWSMEWSALPAILSGTGAALYHAIDLVENLTIHRNAMNEKIDGQGGLAMAEAVSFALAEHMPREAAQALVKKCANEVRQQGGDLLKTVESQLSFSIDRDAIRENAHKLPGADMMIDNVLQAWRQQRGKQ